VAPRVGRVTRGAAERVPTVVIGAGHAGLAASHFLSAHGIGHVVLERGDVANSWRHERWNSLRLLTPNWLARLPGSSYSGNDPDGYMTAAEVASLIQDYASAAGAPLRTGTAVGSLERDGDRYRIRTDAGDLQAQAVVIASGACNAAVIPAVSEAVPAAVDQLTAFDYRDPSQIRDGGVLIVGASATGVQLAAEIKATGRPVTLAVGEHVRMPRIYRGRDVLWWMDASGVWDQSYRDLDDLTRARRLPSPQLVGTPERVTLDLRTLEAAGVELVGRLAAVRDGEALFSGGLRNALNLADLKLARLLDTFDDWAEQAQLKVPASERFAPVELTASPRLKLNLRSGEIGTIVWATGYRPDYSWLNIPVLDTRGMLRHDGGVVTDTPGLYALGLPVLRRRKSTFIHGIENDAEELIAHLAGHLRELERKPR
jgi:putative flavoprotein involved in K+ transport